MSVDLDISSAECAIQGGYYTFTIPQSQSLYAKSCELCEVILPNATYIVQTGVNDSIDYKIGGGGAASFTIPAGGYSIATLLNALQTGTTLTFSYSSDTMKVTVSNASAFVLLFGSGTHAATSCATLLGFTAADTVSGTSVTGTNVAQLYNPLSLLLEVSEFGTTNVLTSNGFSSTFRVPVATASGLVLRLDRNQVYDKVVRVPNTITVSRLNIRLLYRTGTAVNLNGSAFTICLRIQNGGAAVRL